MLGLVTAEVHAANVKKVAEENVAKHKDGEHLRKAFPGSKLGPMVSPMTPKSPQERLAFYTMVTEPSDFGLLMDNSYLMYYRQGRKPAPMSPLWLNLLALPWQFERFRSDFMQLYDSLVRKPLEVQE